MYKMVVSDFFGTLINSEEAISLSTMIELDRIRKEGVLFTITTSKSARLVVDYNKDFPFIDYIVTFNGGYVYDLNNNQVIYDKGLGVTVLRKLYKMFSDKDLCFYTLNYCNYTGKYKDKDYSEMLIDVLPFIEENKNGIYKLKICCCGLREAHEVKSKIEECGLKVVCYIKQDYGVYVVEVTNASNSKLLGIKKILRNNKISLDEVMAICSSSSSVELVSEVGLGISVRNAESGVKKCAKEETLSNEEKGVEVAIKKYF